MLFFIYTFLSIIISFLTNKVAFYFFKYLSYNIFTKQTTISTKIKYIKKLINQKNYLLLPYHKYIW